MILYLETNFIIGAATGRDEHAFELLRVPADKLRIALPSVCIMESLSWFEGELKRRNEFTTRLSEHIHELQRARASAQAKLLLRHLEQARIENVNLLNDIAFHLGLMHSTLAGVLYPAGTRSAELLPLTPETATPNAFGRNMKEPTDELILVTILAHAMENPEEEKVLLSANSRDFDTPAVRALLAQKGIHEYFSRPEAFLGWFHSRARPSSSD